MLKSKRYHSLDAMRGILMIMGVYFHLAIPYAESGAHVLWPFIGLTHSFRMHAFFFISGFFGALIIYRKGSKEMLQNRFKRVFLPLIIFPLLLVKHYLILWVDCLHHLIVVL